MVSKPERRTRSTYIEGSMTAEEFNKALEHIQIKKVAPRTLAAAREVLVDGVPAPQVWEKYGMEKPQLYRFTAKLLKFKAQQEDPGVLVKAILPSNAAKLVETLSEAWQKKQQLQGQLEELRSLISACCQELDDTIRSALQVQQSIIEGQTHGEATPCQRTHEEAAGRQPEGRHR